MALSVSGLKEAIKTELTNEFGAPEDPAQQEKFAQAVAQAIVDYLPANATIVTTCGAGPGSGTLS